MARQTRRIHLPNSGPRRPWNSFTKAEQMENGYSGMQKDNRDLLEYEHETDSKKRSAHGRWRRSVLFRCSGYIFAAIFILNIISPQILISPRRLAEPAACNSRHDGYTCDPQLSHIWGQYSPYFRVPSSISPTAPSDCYITFVQVLSRHGAREPTLHKSVLYAQTIGKIKSQITKADLPPQYQFLRDYVYDLGADQLTDFGRAEMVNEGMDIYASYPDLTKLNDPFIRASGQERVVESAERFAQGFYKAKMGAAADKVNGSQSPYPITVISEDPGSNNTLSHGLCRAFEDSKVGETAQTSFASTFLPHIRDRIATDLSMKDLSLQDTLVLMDLCPFETVADAEGRPSPFCNLFSVKEWEQYDYYQTLGKYYGSGAGNPLGPTQGVGYVNELIARLTGTPVKDSTTVNHTLDDNNPDSFPLDRKVYADFGHDNGMTSVFAALGLWRDLPDLSVRDVMSLDELKGFSAARTVPFAGRAVVEKMSCRAGQNGEFVRVVMNGRVLPLEMCAGDGKGRCKLDAFLKALEFARTGGKWAECFVENPA